MTDLVTIDGIAYRIVDRAAVSYPLAESPAERKARGDLPTPMIAYTSCKIERVRDE